MPRMSMLAGLLLALMTTSCGGGSDGGWPTEKDISNSLQATLQSAAGDWQGVSTVPNALRLDFRLVEGANGQVSGTGTMQEGSAAALPITVSGTFQRPLLTLSFDGMVYESRQVKGSIQGSYTTVGGIAGTLTLTAPGYSRDVAMLLQEK